VRHTIRSHTCLASSQHKHRDSTEFVAHNPPLPVQRAPYRLKPTPLANGKAPLSSSTCGTSMHTAPPRCHRTTSSANVGGGGGGGGGGGVGGTGFAPVGGAGKWGVPVANGSGTSACLPVQWCDARGKGVDTERYGDVSAAAALGVFYVMSTCWWRRCGKLLSRGAREVLAKGGGVLATRGACQIRTVPAASSPSALLARHAMCVEW
jgi:hypothetical protein